MYKDLLLDHSKIENVINHYFSENYNVHNVTVEDKEKCSRYHVEYDGKKFFLDVFLNKNGRITLKVKEGKEQDEKEKLAEYISEHPLCKLADKNSVLVSKMRY